MHRRLFALLSLSALALCPLLLGCSSNETQQADGGIPDHRVSRWPDSTPTPDPDAAPSCQNKANCPAGFVCIGPGVPYCQKGIDNGSPSPSDERCTSGLRTADGICCDRACDGPCEMCAGQPRCVFRPKGAPCGGKGRCINDTNTGLGTFIAKRCDGASAACSDQVLNQPCLEQNCTERGCGTKTRNCVQHSDCTSGYCSPYTNMCAGGPKTCYVDAKAPALGDGTYGRPYATIEGCLASQAPTISVAPGTYAEDPLLDYGVTIIGREALRDSDGRLQPKVIISVSGLGLRISGSRVRLIGLGVRGASGKASSTLLERVGSSSGGSVELEEVLLQAGHAKLSADKVSITSLEARDASVSVHASGGKASLRRIRIDGGGGLRVNAPYGDVELHDLSVKGAYSGLTIGLYTDFRATGIRISNTQSHALRVEPRCEGTISNLLIDTPAAPALVIDEHSYVTLVYMTALSSSAKKEPIALCGPNGGTRLFNSILWTSGQATAASGTCALFNSVQGQDPRLDSSYVPTLGSPAIDRGDDAIAGIKLPATDLAGNPRQVQLSAGALGRSDLGAFERQP